MQALRRSPRFLFALVLALGSAFSLLLAKPGWSQTLEPAFLSNSDSTAIAPSPEPSITSNPTDLAEASGEPAVIPASEAADETTIQAEENVQPIADTELSDRPNNEIEPMSTQADDLLGDRPSPSNDSLSEAFSTTPIEPAVSDDPHLLAQWQTAQSYDVASRKSFRIRFESGLPVPTALLGSARARTVSLPDVSAGIAGLVSVNQLLGGNNSVNFVVEGGEHILAFDFEYLNATQDPRRGFGINIFNQRSWVPSFRGGDRDVDLPNGNTPWVHRLGGGVEYFLPIADNVDSAIGLSYQRVSVRDGMFTSDLEPFDEFGNRLTVDSDGIDDLLTFRIAAIVDNRDTPVLTTSGNRLRLGLDQGFTVGSDSIAFTRLAANYTQYVPFNLFGFSEGPRTLVLNLQGGTIFGDVPPYEGFNLGGSSSVRGYKGGSIGTGSSFLQATAEYRFPVASLNIFNTDLDLRGALFVDYATDLGSGDDVIGEPAEVRDKPGDGLGFGVGLQSQTPFGFARLEFAINDNGGSQFIATFGDRF
ncbi:MAG TPA: BamA/TamA family outer membrane protein [Crinalium sp.]|jgi:outer membrane protein insertion porin family